MAKPQPRGKSAAFVAGLAWVFLIVSIWACFRIPIVWVTRNESASDAGTTWIQLPEILSTILFVTHLALAAFTIYASMALLKFRAWTRSYFTTVLLLIGSEACLAAGWMALGNAATDEPGAVSSIRWAASAALLLLGLCSIVLALKLHRDQGIREVLKP